MDKIPNIGLKKRNNILVVSLAIEEMTSFFLGSLLGINDVENTISLGNKSSSLSFSQKINLLIDIGAISDSEKKKFQKFLEIRNQFMHNIKADTYFKCVSLIDGCDNFLMKNYPQNPSYTKEISLAKSIDNLGMDVFKLTLEITHKIKSKFQDENKAKFIEKSHDIIMSSIFDITKQLDELMDNEIKKNGPEAQISVKKIKKLGTGLRKTIIADWNGKLDKMKW